MAKRIPVNPSVDGLDFRPPTAEDGSSVHTLVDKCDPLDLNSVYNYLILCQHFPETSVIVEDDDGEVVGFVSGYIKPGHPDVWFVWQVAVSSKARGQGVAKRMLKEILQRPACDDVRYLETTITPSNRASWALFTSFAEEIGADCEDEILFADAHFGEHNHEAEHLLRIGPFHPKSIVDQP